MDVDLLVEWALFSVIVIVPLLTGMGLVVFAVKREFKKVTCVKKPPCERDER